MYYSVVSAEVSGTGYADSVAWAVVADCAYYGAGYVIGYGKVLVAGVCYAKAVVSVGKSGAADASGSYYVGYSSECEYEADSVSDVSVYGSESSG